MVAEMGIKFCSWRIFLYVLALVLAEGTGARKLTHVPWKDVVVDPIDWMYSKQKVIGEAKQLGEAAGAREESNLPWKEEEIDPIDWIYSKQNDAQKGRKGSLLKQEFDDQEIRQNDHDLLLKLGTKDNHQGHMDMEHRDPSLNVFFIPRDLKVGKKMKVYFPTKDPSTSPRFLPREEAESIPFSSSQLPYLLQLFSLPKDSPQATAIVDTLNMCELESIEGETKVCATSLESMIDFARSTFGLDTQLKILTNKPLTKPIRPLQNYTILEEPKEIIAPKMVGCHTMPYPYVIYYCHSQDGHQAKVFQVLLGGEDGERMLAAAVCHMDTSHWDRDHVSFRVLKIEPGTAPVCHFLPPDNMVWLPVSA